MCRPSLRSACRVPQHAQVQPRTAHSNQAQLEGKLLYQPAFFQPAFDALLSLQPALRCVLLQVLVFDMEAEEEAPSAAVAAAGEEVAIAPHQAVSDPADPLLAAKQAALQLVSDAAAGGGQPQPGEEEQEPMALWQPGSAAEIEVNQQAEAPEQATTPAAADPQAPEAPPPYDPLQPADPAVTAAAHEYLNRQQPMQAWDDGDAAMNGQGVAGAPGGAGGAAGPAPVPAAAGDAASAAAGQADRAATDAGGTASVASGDPTSVPADQAGAAGQDASAQQEGTAAAQGDAAAAADGAGAAAAAAGQDAAQQQAAEYYAAAGYDPAAYAASYYGAADPYGAAAAAAYYGAYGAYSGYGAYGYGYPGVCTTLPPCTACLSKITETMLLSCCCTAPGKAQLTALVTACPAARVLGRVSVHGRYRQRVARFSHPWWQGRG